MKTYGYTFFSVKEKNKANNKQIGFLLGVTKQTIVRVDLETKEIIQQWQLTQLRRWAASPNSFTLDFGDYADGIHYIKTHPLFMHLFVYFRFYHFFVSLYCNSIIINKTHIISSNKLLLIHFNLFNKHTTVFKLKRVIKFRY